MPLGRFGFSFFQDLSLVMSFWVYTFPFSTTSLPRSYFASLRQVLAPRGFIFISSFYRLYILEVKSSSQCLVPIHLPQLRILHAVSQFSLHHQENIICILTAEIERFCYSGSCFERLLMCLGFVLILTIILLQSSCSLQL